MKLLGILIILILASPVVAEDLDKASKEALDQTVDLLNDPQKIEEAKKSDPKAKQADKTLDSLGFSASEKSEVYGLSSQIFEQIVKEANGDPAKMQKILMDAMKDPEAFAKKWTPEQKAKLKKLTSDAEKSGKKVKKP